MPGLALGPALPAREEGGLGQHRVEPGDQGPAGVREGVPGAPPPLSHAGLHRSRGKTFQGSKHSVFEAKSQAGPGFWTELLI